MGQLLVRDLDDEVIRRLKQRAAAHGRSIEAEHRAILEAALRSETEVSPIETSRQLRQELAQSGPDSSDIIREARARRVPGCKSR
ncbi:MAG TPA: Arc family DNA-binding protein [Acetobacteraceae bacterium]|nr:Arc family DNA-binding protein [Acetobacteraceae bacterium]